MQDFIANKAVVRLRPSRRRSALVAGVVASLAITLTAIGPAVAVNRPVEPAVAGSAGNGQLPDLARLRSDAQARAASFDSFIRSHAARAARARSDLEFHALDVGSARQLLTKDFGSALSATSSTLSSAPALAGHVVRWLSDYKALIRAPDGSEEVATANVPLDTFANGRRSAVDLSLVGARGGFAPRSALRPTWIAGRVSGGLNVDGIRLGLAGGNAKGTVVAHRSVFYGNVAPDVDVVLSPSLRGGEMFEVLRSRRSPEALSWQLGVPAGASIEATAKGLSIVRAGHYLADIPAPVAHDAQGQNVPVTMSVVGHRLVMSVVHRSRDVAYPILVDPVIVFPGFSAPGATFVTGTIGRDGVDPGPTPFLPDGPGRILGPQGGDYSSGQVAQWRFPIPGGVTPTTVYYSYDFLLGLDGGYTYDARGPFYGSIGVGCSGVPMYLGTAMGEVGNFTVNQSSSCSNDTATVTVGTLPNGSSGAGVIAAVDILTINALPHDDGGGGGGPSSDQALAEQFEPVLRFDSSEKWRPLNVDDFLQEGRQYLCDSSTNTCDPTPIEDGGDLANHWDSTAYIQVFPGNFNDYIPGIGFAHDASSYRSPWSQCWVNHLLDCDTGSVSAIYYGVNDPSVAANYQFIDYWYFYRANLDMLNFPGAPNTIDWHEGDWEGMTVALDPSGKTFDYAAFSQHGTFYDYLRSVLRCEDSPSSSIPSAGSCGSTSAPTGSRIDDFVSEGDHANFTTPCSAGVSLIPPSITLCRSTGSGAPDHLETNYNGKQEWGNAFADPTTTLLPLPSGDKAWTYFPGLWGSPNGFFTNPPFVEGGPPRSPGNQPFRFICSTLNNGSNPQSCGTPGGRGNTVAPPPDDTGPICDPCASLARPGQRGDAGAATDGSPGLSALSCASWAGPGVGAAVCNPAELARAVRTGTLGRRGSLTITCSGQGSPRASGQGVAQCAATRPLASQDQVSIAGVAGSGAIVLVRTLDATRRHVIVAQFALRARRGARVASAGPVKLRLVVSGGKNGHSSVTLGGEPAMAEQIVS